MTISGAELGSEPLGFGPLDGTPRLPIGKPALTVFRDPETRAQSIDDRTLQLKATTVGKARVLNVIQTIFGTDSRLDGGLTLPGKINTNFGAEAQVAINTALRAEQDDGAAIVKRVSVRTSPLGRAQLAVRFVDLTTGEEDEVVSDVA